MRKRQEIRRIAASIMAAGNDGDRSAVWRSSHMGMKYPEGIVNTEDTETLTASGFRW